MINPGPFLELYAEVLAEPVRWLTLLGRRAAPTPMLTFLGHEVKAGRKRFTCPDIPTSRYISLFLRIGVSRVAIPYNPLRTSRLIGPLERALETMLDGATPAARRYRLGKLKRYLEAIHQGLKRKLPHASK